MESTHRIVSLLSSATEILFAIGLGDRVVAVSHECDFPPAVANLPRVTSARVESLRDSREIDNQVRDLSAAGDPLYDIDGNRLAELQPGLIVTQAQCDVCAVSYRQVLDLVASDPRLQRTQVLALSPGSLDDVLSDIEGIGQAAGAEQAAAGFVAQLRKKIQAVSCRTAPVPQEKRPRTICIEWIEPLMLAANWTPELIEMAGGQNGLSIGGQHSIYMPWQQVVDYDPEVVLVAPCGFDLPRTVTEAKRLSQWNGWHSLSAVQTSRVFAIDGNAYLNRSGPRLVESLEILAHLIQPALFPAPPVPAGSKVPYTRLQV